MNGLLLFESSKGIASKRYRFSYFQQSIFIIRTSESLCYVL